MNISFDWPTITADDLEKRAIEFAQDLATRLEKFNSEVAGPEMDAPFSGAVPGPNPAQFTDAFKRVFCHYMAARQIIIPSPRG